MRQYEQRSQQIVEVFRAREILTALTLLVSLLISYNVWQNAVRISDRTLNTAFDYRVREASDGVQQRLQVYEQVLRSVVAFFVASDNITRSEFRDFVRALSLPKRYPGIQGIGYALQIPPSELSRHTEEVRAQGFPEYRIKPEGERELYTSIVYLEPFSDTNQRAFGYDMYSEENRRAAMAEARDTGQPAISEKVALVQDAGSDVQAAFLMYLPVYRTGVPVASVEQRRENLLGWVYAPFRINDFMRGVLGELHEDLDIEIYERPDIAEEARIFDSDPNVSGAERTTALRMINRIVVGNRVWTIVATSTPEFEESVTSDRPLLILQAGISISFLITLLIWLFLDDRARALQAAHQAMQLALYDVLTGLPNRKLLDERLQQSLAAAKRSHANVALLFIDLDKFKPVNDNFGHAYGDLLLKEVAKRLEFCMRESDTASRLGGDEFVVLLSEVEGRSGAKLVAEKILGRLTHPYEIAGHTFVISASIGVAIYPQDGKDGKSLMKAADLAMYDAKNSGRSTVRPAGTEA